MGRQIVRQPDGLYAIFSTVADGFIYYDCTAKEVEEVYAEEAAAEAVRNVRDVINKISLGVKPYYQFTRTFEEAEDLHDSRHDKVPFGFRAEETPEVTP